jgi:mannose-6-phosphate isomerase-like protein (cupin superfamily)
MRDRLKKLEADARQARFKLVNSVFFNQGVLSGMNQVVYSFPERWEPFFKGKKDLIKGIHHKDGKDAISCLYNTVESGVFHKHFHESADEYLFVVRGKLIIHTPFDHIVLQRGESYTIPAGLGHYAEFEENTEVIITWLGQEEGFLSFNFYNDSIEAPADCKRALLSVLRERHSAMVQNGEMDEKAMEQILLEIEEKEKHPCRLYSGCHESCEFFVK